MSTLEIIIQILYYGFYIFLFYKGFSLVHTQLTKVYHIRGRKLRIADWITCVLFGLVFSTSITFGINLLFFIVDPVHLPNTGGYFLLLLFSLLIVYPLWEIFFLAKPTSDAITNYHKYIESKFIDRVEGNRAYLVSFVIFSFTYILPIFLISKLTNTSILNSIFIWCLLIPLFFLSYYSASGLMANVFRIQYSDTTMIKGYSALESSQVTTSYIKLVLQVIVWIPFILAAYNVINPIIQIASSGTIQHQEITEIGMFTIDNALISLLTTVLLGIQGFFTRFWLKKTKLKPVDFLFSAYIFIAIALNMLISVLWIDPEEILNLFGVEVFGIQPLIGLEALLNNSMLILPILICQNVFTIVYASRLFIKKNHEIYADIRMTAVQNAYSIKSVFKLNPETLKNPNEILSDQGDFLLLLKSVILAPEYNEFGIDINNAVRIKGEQSLVMVCIKNPDITKYIVEFLFDKSIQSGIYSQNVYVSKDALRTLGNIAQIYPQEVIPLLLSELDKNNPFNRTNILYILGMSHTEQFDHEIQRIILNQLNSDDVYIKMAALQSIGSFGDRMADIDEILEELYKILENPLNNPQILDLSLTIVLQLCPILSKSLKTDYFLPYLNYHNSRYPEKESFIVQNAINILGYISALSTECGYSDLITPFLQDSRSFIRIAALNLLGNTQIGVQCPSDEIICKIFETSLYDDNEDVRRCAIDTFSELILENPNLAFTVHNENKQVLQHYLEILITSSATNNQLLENSSEALKILAPYIQDQIYSIIKNKLTSKNEKIIQNILHMLGNLPLQHELDLEILYGYLLSEKPSIRAESVQTLGLLAENGQDVDLFHILPLLKDRDPLVRYQAIFAFGKIGLLHPKECALGLIQRYYEIDHRVDVQELELICESLGLIGEVYPSNSIIITLQQALLGDTNPLAKDVIARALYLVAQGMLIQNINAMSLVEKSEIKARQLLLGKKNHTLEEIEDLLDKHQYTVGDILIILIDALDIRVLPDSITEIICDVIQDLLPAFLFQKDALFFETIYNILKQVYSTNLSFRILVTIDRINSLLYFKHLFQEGLDLSIRTQFRYYAIQLTEDPQQWIDQGNLYLKIKIPHYLEYAKESFLIAQELTPKTDILIAICYEQLALINKEELNHKESRRMLEKAYKMYAAFDDIIKMREMKENLEKLKILEQK